MIPLVISLVFCVTGGLLARSYMVMQASKPPPHRHFWEEVNRHTSTTYAQINGRPVTKEEAKNSLPISRTTTFLMRCAGCGELDTEELDGHYQKKDEQP